MAKEKNFYYVMVMAHFGPAFVTSVDYLHREASWEGTEPPKEFGSFESANDMTKGLNLNGHLAYTVCSQWELDSQPYLYNIGRLVWQQDTKEEVK